MKDIGNKTDALLEVEVGGRYLWCGRDIIIHDRRMGMALVEYLSPSGVFGWHDGFWAWSHGGGRGLRASHIDAAAEQFEVECRWREGFFRKTLANPNAIIVNGTAYTDGGHEPAGMKSCLGFGGRLWGIECLTTGRKFKTNNLWHNGKIPAEIVAEDTHRFISPDAIEDTNRRTNAFRLSVEQQSVVDA